MKKSIFVLLVVIIMALSLSLVGCDDDDGTNESQSGSDINTQASQGAVDEDGTFGEYFSNLHPNYVLPEDEF